MNIDKFGRSDTTARAAFRFRSPNAAASFPKTRDGNYDLSNLKLCNVGPPTLPEDAATKSYVDKQTRDGYREVHEEIDLQTQLNVSRMISSKNKTIEEISVKYDEKLKSLWDSLEQMNVHIDNTEQGITTALATFPDVENALNTLANQVSENIAAIRQEIDHRMHQPENLQINEEDLKNKIQSQLRGYIDRAVKYETDRYGDRVEIAIATANTGSKERLELEQKLQKKFDKLIDQTRISRAECALWHQDFMSTKSSIETRLTAITSKAEKAIAQISDSVNQLGTQLTVLEQALVDQGLYTGDPRKRSTDGQGTDR